MAVELSFIIPAHNEETALGTTLDAINNIISSIARPCEIIVVDDCSTDATAQIALQRNARVISVSHRQIAATRNAGGRAAGGEILFFVDADTIASERAVRAALRAIDRGAVGGGAPVYFDGGAPLYARLLLAWLEIFMRIAALSGGAFLFCRRDTFRTIGGFDEKLYGAEDVAMCWSLKQHGRFALLWSHVKTSGRRVGGINGFRMVTGLLCMAVFPRMLRQRSRVQRIWYDSNRTSDREGLSPLAMRVFNFIALILVVVIVTGPIWSIPFPEKFLVGPVPAIRFAAQIVGVHVGLVLWPCIYFLCRILLRQPRWTQRIKLTALILLCTWLAWGNLWEFIGFWNGMYAWATR
jgi:cellulose synthase/poly-beta-1,6-N-acetylglucosamine synthase-like glycosyltransferase